MIHHQQDAEIEDPLGPEDEIMPFEYSITSYGADYLAEMLVNRLNNEELLIPPFQRSYVWNLRTASKFIESLLLGLPVPGIFLSRESTSQKHLVLDGQQRLKSLQFFFDGVFTPTGRVFKLDGVQTRFSGLTYKELDDGDRRRLHDSIIHATIVRQDNPSEDESSIYHIFERLNSGGRALTPQEIRRSLFHGEMVSLLEELNSNESWRSIYGPRSKDLRDQELILRFLAFRFFFDSYEAPMKVFLNRYMGRNRNLTSQSRRELMDAFIPSIDLAYQALGDRAFRPQKALNAAVFDSILVALSRRISEGPVPLSKSVHEAYEDVLANSQFQKGTERATANFPRIRQRFDAAQDRFRDIP